PLRCRRTTTAAREASCRVTGNPPSQPRGQKPSFRRSPLKGVYDCRPRILQRTESYKGLNEGTRTTEQRNNGAREQGNKGTRGTRERNVASVCHDCRPASTSARCSARVEVFCAICSRQLNPSVTTIVPGLAARTAG